MLLQCGDGVHVAARLAAADPQDAGSVDGSDALSCQISNASTNPKLILAFNAINCSTTADRHQAPPNRPPLLFSQFARELRTEGQTNDPVLGKKVATLLPPRIRHEVGALLSHIVRQGCGSFLTTPDLRGVSRPDWLQLDYLFFRDCQSYQLQLRRLRLRLETQFGDGEDA